METWDAITARRNVREFEDRPLPRECPLQQREQLAEVALGTLLVIGG
jgi:hypothetical protein